MQEKLRELIAHCKNTGMTNGKWFAGELEAALADTSLAEQPTAFEYKHKPKCPRGTECKCGLTKLLAKLNHGYKHTEAAVIAAAEPTPRPEQIIEIDEDGKVHYPPCTCFTCPQHGELLKAIEQREQIRLAKSNKE